MNTRTLTGFFLAAITGIALAQSTGRVININSGAPGGGVHKYREGF